ncbi:glutamate [Lichtheimia corymbifera JMRC:FSU:9682]|uniref:Glutamate n=1 Tax=Lichtheimia corymbifera JMRC:FSU:9682 TaxID=1263082 RepID=A0A068RZZ7_9FUNG|nr:glutamate [Lichtheimia corymbifera JMRC:FSU:9682]
MAAGYDSLSSHDGGESSNKPLSAIDRAKSWWKGGEESQPLLGSRHVTNDQGSAKQSTAKKVALYGGILAACIALAGSAAWLLLEEHESSLPSTVPKMNKIEKVMYDLPVAENMREYLRHYTSEAHLAGSEGDKRLAEWTRDKFIEFGITNSSLETYYPLLNYPVKHRFGIVSGPEEFQYEATLTEDVVDEDETSHTPDVVPSFHGYSKNGTARGPVVYANYGRVEDFQYLVDQGIELNGTIALVRYGGAVRGLKIRAAAQFGCVGTLIYSDPLDDGPIDKEGYPHVNPAKSYPEGPWRPESSVQRGSVSYISFASGDPLTPGYAATKDAPRLKQEDLNSLPNIPSLPLSYRDALPLLKATQGRGVQNGDWAGGLEDVGYFSGPTEGEAILENIVDYKVTPIWNVIGTIEGSVEPDRVVVLGNHRDAWVYGAVDPNSGSATMLELARTFGELLKTGWRPARTIVLASWDGEEYGLIGSTEHTEDHKEWLSKNGVAYINVDVAVSGPNFGAGASPSLNQLLYDVTSLVEDPLTGGNVYDAWHKFTNFTVEPAAKPYVNDLGSGSDFVGFLNYIGMASISIDFSGDYGVYHSVYDSFHWMDKFGDPGFLYHQTMCRIWGLMALRLADSPILPIHPADYADALSGYMEDISSYAADAVTKNKIEIDDEQQRFPVLSAAIDKLSDIATKFEKKLQSLETQVHDYSHLDSVPQSLLRRLRKINEQLMYFERGLLDPEGIQERTWFKHIVYAPGYWTGYSSQVFPAIADALDAGDAKMTTHKESRAALCVQKAANTLV